jgi:ribosomal protein L3 glutamine methyltransferase
MAHISVDCTDLSPDALEVAAGNIEMHDVGDRVVLYESDLFQNLGGKKYDVIVTNPPYVDLEDMETLPEEYKHEPRFALESGDDGLDATRIILKEAANHLTEHGVLIVEVGNSLFHLNEQYPQVPFTWLEFARGGEGVFLLTYEQLVQYQDQF